VSKQKFLFATHFYRKNFIDEESSRFFNDHSEGEDDQDILHRGENSFLDSTKFDFEDEIMSIMNSKEPKIQNNSLYER
jgi:hypothetical protein